MTKFSVITSVYKNDKPEFVRIALDSLLVGQTVMPDDIVLVQDGAVSDVMADILCKYEDQYPEIFNIIRLEKNCGLGNAMKIGVDKAKNEIIARMDSDDISTPDRFEKQLKYMKDHPDVAVCGGQISEFIDDPQNIVGKRICPCSDYAIKQYMKKRCGFNHMTVAFRRSKVLEAGNYQPWFWNEDYYLWIRMMLAGCKFANLPNTLVNVRVGKEMYARRGGWKYFCSELDLQKYMRHNGLISLPRFCFNVAMRWMVQVAFPNKIRGIVFQKIFRNH